MPVSSLSLLGIFATHQAILRETSIEISNQVIRWVFRPYAHLCRAICTSASRQPFTEISLLHNIGTHSSSPFESWWKGFNFMFRHQANQNDLRYSKAWSAQTLTSHQTPQTMFQDGLKGMDVDIRLYLVIAPSRFVPQSLWAYQEQVKMLSANSSYQSDYPCGTCSLPTSNHRKQAKKVNFDKCLKSKSTVWQDEHSEARTEQQASHSFGSTLQDFIPSTPFASLLPSLQLTKWLSEGHRHSHAVTEDAS